MCHQRGELMSEEESREAFLEKELTRVRQMLNNATDALDDERRASLNNKNRIPGGYYMMSRSAEKNLRLIQSENPAASQVFSIIREHMQIGSNAVTVSQVALCHLLNKSRSTIARATKYLAENNYIQVIKTGNSSTYIVNEKIAFAGTPGQRKAVFSSTVVAHESEQEKGWEKVEKLKAIPVIYHTERAYLNDEELPPPDQKDLELI